MSRSSPPPRSPEPAPDSASPPEDPHKAAEGTIRTSLDRVIARAADGIAWLVFIAMAISVFEVIMRYVFNAPTSWAHESTVMLIAALFALGGPVALARDKHIRVRVIYDSVSPRVRHWLDLFNNTIVVLFCGGMSYAAWQLFYRASHSPTGVWQLERSGTSWNPPFPAMTKGLILFAVALMTVQAVLHLIQTLRARPARPDGEDR
ncbi:TRAP transporter small permease subunit [Roseospira visakhapatnamensis]|uniref:TRAP transporter small permease protein n=1 Tax=Roseospira visakhapatnamensis TaxID=390880 RepID=A0A7W6RBL2_9PROT|nr:TRAP transporter small permease subunit [Roseospira visakhapatnamensis]MBB4265525.1 TRAP-type C4-dicarboxylate transport system permease small subunit [Roseospira visakhapatnamensis]